MFSRRRCLPLWAATLAALPLAARGVTAGVAPPSANGPAADEVIAALYAGVSGPAGHPRDWAAFARLFVPGARIGVTQAGEGKGVAVRLMTVDEFGELNDRTFAGRGFFENEIHREQSGFGDVLHVWSVYEARRSPSEAPYARGANSLQMLRTAEGWQIAALTWDHERPGQSLAGRFPVPARMQGVGR